MTDVPACYWSFECDECKHFRHKVCLHNAAQKVKQLNADIDALQKEIVDMQEENMKLKKILKNVYMEDQ